MAAALDMDAVGVSKDAIRATLRALRAHSGAGPLPSESDLRALVETALWAGLRREEGRPLSFSFAYVPQQQCEPNERIDFASPVRLVPSELARIAPALLPKTSRFGVSSLHGSLRVWGITLDPPPCVKVRALAPGRVVVKYGLENAAVLEPPDNYVVAGNLRRCMQLITSGIGRVGTERPVLAALVLMITDVVRRHGNGGALLVGPHEDRAWLEALEPRLVRSRSPAAGLSADLAEMERSAMECKAAGLSEFEAAQEVPAIRAFLNEEQLEEPLNRRVASIGQLSAIDGALVMDDQLQLIDFGAKIRPQPPAWYRERTIPLRTTSKKRLGEVGGTRHRSALGFVQATKAVALVASHDGPLSLFVHDRERGGVVCMRHLERLID